MEIDFKDIKEIEIKNNDTFNSKYCEGRAKISSDNEDPEFNGKIKLLDIEKINERGLYYCIVKIEHK